MSKKLRNMKEISIKIPYGKRAVQKEVDGKIVIEIVDENPITERVKTFADALREVGIKESVEEWEKKYSNLEKDVVAYMKLRIIADALNEGGKLKIVKGAKLYSPLFEFMAGEEETVTPILVWDGASSLVCSVQAGLRAMQACNLSEFGQITCSHKTHGLLTLNN
nr:MAG TPA_asm: hypothetical protein [Caudoviricetes sp.]